MTEHGLQLAASRLLAAQIASDVEDIKAGQQRIEERRRPILTHLNADTSWLLSVPVPFGAEHREGNKYLHLVLDPWFKGTQEDVHGWFSKQWHKEESRYQTLEEVEDLISSIEGLEIKSEKVSHKDSFDETKVPGPDMIKVDSTGTEASTLDGSTLDDGCLESLIDGIIISHEFTDHMHEATLRSAQPSIPIFAPKGKAIDLLHSWGHFDTVIPIELTPSPEEEEDWRKWCPGLEERANLEWATWCKVTRLMAPEKSMIGYHEGVLMTWPRPGTSPGQYTNFPVPNPGVGSRKPDLASGSGEAVIYTPHGLPASACLPLSKNMNITTLALLHGEHDIRLPGAQLNLGEKNGKEVVRETKAKYWCATHDEVKHGSGLVSWFLSRTLGKGKEIVAGERRDKAAVMESELGCTVACRTVDNGARLVLV